MLAGREKDREDVVAILRAGGHGVDLTSVRRMLTELEESLSQSDLLPFFERCCASSLPRVATKPEPEPRKIQPKRRTAGKKPPTQRGTRGKKKKR